VQKYFVLCTYAHTAHSIDKMRVRVRDFGAHCATE
jgi:hypothetical protein